jgi:hypothetical protein
MLEERIKRQAKTRPLPGTGVQESAPAKPAGGPKINPPGPEKSAGGSSIPGVRSRPATAGTVPPSETQSAAPSRLPSAFGGRAPVAQSAARPVSGAFTLDLEKIESAVDKAVAETGLKLVNHRLDDILNDEPIALPPTMTGRRNVAPFNQVILKNCTIY